MNSPWQPINPGPQDLKALPLWATGNAAFLIGSLVLCAVVYFRWPGKEALQDSAFLIDFAIDSAVTSGLIMTIYAAVVVLGTLYEKYPGETAVDPDAGRICVTGLLTPAVYAAMFVGFTWSMPITIGIVVILAAFLKSRETKST